MADCDLDEHCHDFCDVQITNLQAGESENLNMKYWDPDKEQEVWYSPKTGENNYLVTGTAGVKQQELPAEFNPEKKQN